MLSTWIQSKKDEEGFTLIELLVVVIIIGILAAIAIPVFLNQRENAWRSAAESDIRNSAIEVESYLTREDAYPADQTVFETLDLPDSAGVTMEYTLVDSTSYTIEAAHDNVEGTVTYDSAAGGVQPWDEDGELAGTGTGG